MIAVNNFIKRFFCTSLKSLECNKGNNKLSYKRKKSEIFNEVKSSRLSDTFSFFQNLEAELRYI